MIYVSSTCIAGLIPDECAMMPFTDLNRNNLPSVSHQELVSSAFGFVVTTHQAHRYLWFLAVSSTFKVWSCIDQTAETYMLALSHEALSHEHHMFVAREEFFRRTWIELCACLVCNGVQDVCPMTANLAVRALSNSFFAM